MRFTVQKVDTDGKEFPMFTLNKEGLDTLFKTATPFKCYFKIMKIAKCDRCNDTGLIQTSVDDYTECPNGCPRTM